jgi:tetratricopeptide (TPR) repeat protein
MSFHGPMSGVCRSIVIASAALFLGLACAAAQTKQGKAPAPAEEEVEGCGGRRAGTPDERIAACTQIIDSRRASAEERAEAFRFRAVALRQKNELDRALADHDQSIKLNPKAAVAFAARALTWQKKNELDRAIADLDQAHKLAPKNAVILTERGVVYRMKGDVDRAIADHSAAIRIDPKFANAFNARGFAYRQKADHDRAMADYDRAIKLVPNHLLALGNRASLWRAKGEFDRAIVDLDTAIRAHPRAPAPLVLRGQIYEAKDDRVRAEADFKAALALPASEERAQKAKETARTRLALLTSGEPAPAKPATVPSAADGARVALVIGNSAYAHTGALPNPANDARAIAKALREIGFDVSEGIDLGHTAQEQLVRSFLRKASGARIALMFYAGHGVQVDGKNYLVPVDAKLAARTDLQFETLDLDRVMSGLDDEGRTNLIILDACRDNPLGKNLATRARSTGGGLAAISSVGTGTLIAFATAPNEMALDGAGTHSPFTTALLKHIRTPGLEVRQMLSRVRAEVVAATQKKQIPWDNSSLLGDVYLAGTKKL